ncbi:copper homeostasis protein CutC [Flavobacteriaceae bacterium]|nr:copper homeostasis protein CutC [Flavobacteriaceae bacterium]
MQVEVCASSISSIKNAAAAGADRIELCAALEVGGLTPSFGLIKEAIALELLPIHCLIRPRQGHFFYTKDEISIIEQNIISAVALGCHGIVVGIHTQDFNLDLPLLKKWRLLAENRYLTFHRAFDVLIEPAKALEQLIDMGFDCVLTSGQHEKAEDGLENLKRWNANFGSQISIMPGSGVGDSNVELFKKAGFSSLHLSGSKELPSLFLPDGVNHDLSFLHQPLRESNQEVLQQVVQAFKSS